MIVALSGASGFVGSHLKKRLEKEGHTVKRLVRHPASDPAEIQWNPEKNFMDEKAMEGLEALVHLAGEPVADVRWTPQKKEKIRLSRVQGTRLIAETLVKLQRPPRIFISASATGFYGSRADEILTETSSAGTGFLAQVCQEWEEASVLMNAKGIRRVNGRIGFVFSKKGGGLPRMLLPFRLGLGGPVGDGRQYVGWITLEDLIGAFLYILKNENICGPVNLVSPMPVTNRELAQTLGKVLHRPAILPLPAFAVRILMGEVADELLLASTRVIPQKLLDSGYSFQYPNLEEALRKIIKEV